MNTTTAVTAVTNPRITKKAARAEIARRKLDHNSPEYKAQRPRGKNARLVQLKGWQLREILDTPVVRRVKASA